MAKTKISTIAKELNVALPTVYSFLSEKGISIEESPNTRVDDDVVGLLVSKFKPDKDLKNKSDQFAANRRSTPAPAPKEAPKSRRPFGSGAGLRPAPPWFSDHNRRRPLRSRSCSWSRR